MVGRRSEPDAGARASFAGTADPLSEQSFDAQWTFSTHASPMTEAVGEALGRALRGMDAIVCLWGPLGAGKTTFTRGIARGLGVSGAVHSPSFVLAHEHHGTTPLCHVDLYRIARVEELVEAGIDAWLHSNGVCALEWPERLGPWLPAGRVDVQLDFVGAEVRSVIVTDRGVGLLRLWPAGIDVEANGVRTHLVL